MANSSQSPQNFIGIELCAPTLRAAIVTEHGNLLERREAPFDLRGLGLEECP